MCEPTTIMMTTLAISAAASAAQYQQQQQQAKKQGEAIKHGNELETASLARQYDEQNAVAQEQLADRARQHLQDLGRLNAVSSETGAAGNSTNRILDNEAQGAAQDIVTIQSNARRTNEQSHSQGMGAKAQADAMFANLRYPSALGAGLQIGASAVSAYNQYDKATKDRTTAKGLDK